MGKNIIGLRPEALIEARYNLTAKENDIIDMVLNIIKDDGKYVYKIDIQKYKHLLKDYLPVNVYRDMKNATKELFNKHNKFIIKDKRTGKEFYFVWFSMLNYNDKEGSIYFEIGDTLKQILLEMKKRIYYKLEYTLNFRSIYSKKIYYMLKSFQDTGWRIDNIEELKYKLNCPQSYKNYTNFIDKVIDVAQREINYNSDISFDYEGIRTGRKVTSLKFYIHTNSNSEIAAAADITPEVQTQDVNIKQVQAIFSEEISVSEAKKIHDAANGDIELIKEKYAIVKDIDDCKNVVGAVITAIKEGWTHKKSSNSSNGFKAPRTTFNSYDQRHYDIKKLENKLLGREKEEYEK